MVDKKDIRDFMGFTQAFVSDSRIAHASSLDFKSFSVSSNVLRRLFDSESYSGSATLDLSFSTH